MDINFIGIKIGDVNGNSKSKNFSNDVTDSRSKVNLTINDVKVNRGDIIEIPVMASSSETMYGMQAQVKANGLIIREVKEGQVKLRYDDVIITDVNEARLSIVATDGIAIHKSEVIFIIEVEALKSGNLSEMLQLGQGITPELYTTEMETKNLALSWRSNSLKEFMLTGTAPNPWNTHTVLTFDLPKDGMVTFKVKDYTGRKVVSAIEQFQGGNNTIQINRSDIGLAGVYIYEIKFEDKVLSGKMIVID